MLREVMKLSALEHKKVNGEINIDKLKKKNQVNVAKENNPINNQKPEAKKELPPVEIGKKLP